MLARPLSSYYLLLASSGLLLLIGLTMVFSATSVKAYAEHGNAFSAIRNQALFAAARPGRLLGLPAAAGPHPARPRQVRPGRGVVLLAVLDLLIALESVERARRAPRSARSSAELLWLYIGPIGRSSRPSWPSSAWCCGAPTSSPARAPRWATGASWRCRCSRWSACCSSWSATTTWAPCWCLLALIVGLLWAAGVRLRVFAALGVLGLAGIGLLIAAASRGAGSGEAGAENYRLARLTTFLKPPEDCDLGACYQLLQGRSAIYEGGWFGVGLGKSALKWDWLPEADNDFIFAVVAEELGVVGCVVVLALFSVLAYTGFRIARRVDDPFRRLAAAAHHHLAGRPGRDQHRRRGRPAADHRPAAAVHLRRRQRPGRDDGRDRHARLVRPRRARRRPGPERPSAGSMGAASLGPAAAASPAAAAGPTPTPAATGRAGAGVPQTAGGAKETVMGLLRSVVLAGGGTGGHIYPLLAFADCLRRHVPARSGSPRWAARRAWRTS